MKQKRILSVAAVVCLLFLFMAGTAAAADEFVWTFPFSHATVRYMVGEKWDASAAQTLSPDAPVVRGTPGASQKVWITVVPEEGYDCAGLFQNNSRLLTPVQLSGGTPCAINAKSASTLSLEIRIVPREFKVALEANEALTNPPTILTTEYLAWSGKDTGSEGSGFTIGNYNLLNTRSTLAIQVQGPALVTYERYLSSAPSCAYLVRTVDTEVSHSTLEQTEPKLSGSYTAWTKDECVVPEGEHMVYLTYIKKDVTASGYSDTARVRNIQVITDTATVSTGLYNAESAAHGSVSGQVTGFLGQTVTVSAHTNANSIFSGWFSDVETGSPKLLSESAEYSFVLERNTSVYAGFAPKGVYKARTGTHFFETLEEALTGAEAGDKIVLMDNAALTQDAQLKEGVTLLVPYQAGDAGYNPRNGEFSPANKSMNGQTGRKATLYCTLTVPQGVTFTVDGTLIVNALTGRPAAGHYDQDITGGYGKIALDGTLLVRDGGLLESMGLIQGSGQVTAQAGSVVNDLYVVRHWRGGSQAAEMYFNDVYPMNEIDCHNIETLLRVESGASYQGVVRMYASGSYYETRFPQINNENGLIRLSEGAYVLKSFTPKSAGSYEGTSTLKIYGGAIFSRSALVIVGLPLSTGDYLFPIDGDTVMELHGGSYRLSADMKLMPGFRGTIFEDAALTVDKDVKLIAYDVFNDKVNTSTTQYPSRPAAQLVLNGGAALTVNGSFAGQVVPGEGADPNHSARLRLSGAQSLALESKEANGYYTSSPDKQYTVTLNFATQLVNGDSVQVLPDDAASSRKTWFFDGASWTTKNPIQLPGDVNGDGTVNVNDLNLLLSNYNKSGLNLPGDINADNIVNVNDLNDLLSNYNKTLES